ncbi:MAG: cytidine deaminase [Lentihominibacter sp.]
MFEKVRAEKAEKTMKDRYEELYFAAESVRVNSYSPYSDFSVGAALLVRPNEDSPLPINRKYFGVNIENGSYGATLCAERAAFASAITDGVLKYETGKNPFIAIAVSAGEEEAVPCGICRQFMYEFNPDMDVVTKAGGKLKIRKLRDLMPEGFTLDKTGNFMDSPAEEKDK